MSSFALVVASVLILVCNVSSAFSRAVSSASILVCNVSSPAVRAVSSASIFACRTISAFSRAVSSVCNSANVAFSSNSFCKLSTSLISIPVIAPLKIVSPSKVFKPVKVLSLLVLTKLFFAPITTDIFNIYEYNNFIHIKSNITKSNFSR